AAVLPISRLAIDYFDRDSIAHISIRYQLKLFAESIYEYHSVTGRWPATIDDLAQTSLPDKTPPWRTTASLIVFRWPQNLNPDPKANVNVILLYYNAGLLSSLGRKWVCWGDLRTEYLRSSDLTAHLR